MVLERCSNVDWEFTATWNDNARQPWCWAWRRVSDDAGKGAPSRRFASLDACIEDARRHGFEDEEDTVALLASSL